MYTITAQGVTAPFGTGGTLDENVVGNIHGLAPLTSPVNPPPTVPEPATMQPLGFGLVGLVGMRKFKR